MANRTDKSAYALHGKDPQLLVEKILRNKVYESLYWKEKCFGLNEEGILDEAVVAISEYGGPAAPNNAKVTPFLSLLLKTLAIQPKRDIVLELIRNEDFKYVRLLGALYLRMTGRPAEVYNYLEPLYNDYRRVRVRNVDGSLSLKRVDEVAREMLTSDTTIGIALPRLPKRSALEESGILKGARKSALADEFEAAKVKRLQELEEEKARELEEIGAAVQAERERGRDGGSDRGKRRRDRADGFGGYGEPRSAREDKEQGEYDAGGDARGDGGSGGGNGGGGKDELDVDATNALRAKLGLAPLKE